MLSVFQIYATSYLKHISFKFSEKHKLPKTRITDSKFKTYSQELILLPMQLM